MSDGSPVSETTLVASDAALAEACRRWSAARLIGIDTEFVRERTYYPRPGLVQVADEEGVLLVDPLSVTDFSPLAGILGDPAVTVVMHAYGEDLDVFEVLGGATPTALFDTQRAAAFAGHGASLGYRALVELLLGVQLDKGETRSDWLRRPLTSSQIRYALLDVTYLRPLYDRLSQDLTALGRRRWLDEELEHLRRARADEGAADIAYLRVKGRGALTPPRHVALRALAAWREREAIARDLPRRHVLPDVALVALATLPAPDRQALARVRGLSQAARIRYGDAIIACLEASDTEPGPLDRTVDLRPHAALLERLKAVVAAAAGTLRLPAELLASRRMLEALVVRVRLDGGELPPEFTGWRFDPVGRRLLEVLREVG